MNALIICGSITLLMFGASSLIIAFGVSEFLTNKHKKENVVHFDFSQSNTKK